MVFSSATFLYAFLPLTLLLYALAPKRLKNAVLLGMSLVFYAFGEPRYVALLLLSSVSDFLHGLYIEKRRGTRQARAALVSSIVLNLGFLGFFKYTDFLLGTVNDVFGTAIPLLHLRLPVGISFYTFQTMSYTIDVYRGRVHAQRNLATFATFVCLFPQLIAGPIVRYSDIDTQLKERKSSLADFGAGARRFTVGLAKKVMLANTLGELCARYAASDEKSVLFSWLYAIAFLLQIYYDFSGYSDMAIGLGRMFGFDFPENFDYPYCSRSITEFWRRWHMTLGGWFRDYVYFPLGGSRTDKTWKLLRNLAVVWLLTGLWHGAAWNFVLWGGLFGVVLMLEKTCCAGLISHTPRALQHLYVLLLVTLSFVLFNASGVSDAFGTIGRMFGLGGAAAWGTESRYLLKSNAVLLLLAAVGATRAPKRIGDRLLQGRAALALEPLGVAVLLTLSTACIVDGSFNPFLYFRF